MSMGACPYPGIVVQFYRNPQEVNWSHDFAGVLENVSKSMVSVAGRE